MKVRLIFDRYLENPVILVTSYTGFHNSTTPAKDILKTDSKINFKKIWKTK